MSRLFQPLCFNQVQSRVWGRLGGLRAESSGTPADVGSIIFQLNPLMSPSVSCVRLYLKQASNLGPSVPADQLVFVSNPSLIRELPTAAFTHTPAAPLVVWTAHFKSTKKKEEKKLCSLLERAPPGLAESRYRSVAMRRASWRGADNRERHSLGEPQCVNHSRTPRHQTKPITLEIRSVGS